MKIIDKQVLVKIGSRDRVVTFTRLSQIHFTAACVNKSPIKIEKTKEGYVGSLRSDSNFLVKTNPKKHPGLAFEVLVRDFWSRR